MTNYLQKFNPLSGNFDLVTDHRISNVIEVAVNGGAQFTSIQDAIASVTTASASNPYVLHIAPGVYTGDIDLKPFVNLVGVSTGVGSPELHGKITGTFIGASDIVVLTKLSIFRGIAADGEVVINVAGSLIVNDIFMYIYTNQDYGFTGISMTNTVNKGSIDRSYIICSSTYDGSTKNINGIVVNGTNGFTASNNTVEITSKNISGNITARCINSTDGLHVVQNQLIISNTKALFAGECCISKVTGKTTGVDNRFSQSENFRITGVSGGTSIGMDLTAANGADMFYVGTLYFSNGFTNEYTTRTALSDTQKVWLQSTNKDLIKNGNGLSIMTPYDLHQTGFVDWSSVAGNNYLVEPVGGVGSTCRVTLLKRAVGVFKSAPVLIPANQFVDLPTQNATYYIYAKSSGVLSVTLTPDFESMILLFAVFSDGTNYAVSNQVHYAKFCSAVANEWHEVLGSSMENDGLGIITRLSSANRTIQIVGSTTYHDNGLDSDVPDSAGAAITMKMFYTAAGGVSINGADFTQIPSVCQAANVIAAIPNGRTGVIRIGVMPSNNIDGTNSNAQYVAIPNAGTTASTATFSGTSAAINAISSNSITPFPTPVGRGLEAIMLGYVIISVTAGGVATIPSTNSTNPLVVNGVTPAKQVFGANFAAGSSSSAGSVVTDTANFDRLLTPTETSVQLALDKIDNEAAKFVAGDIDVTSFAGANNQVAAAVVTGLLFANATVRSFRASVSITIAATAPLYESVYIYGIQRGADWVITTSSVGDDSLIAFTITATGQLQYTSANLAGWTATTMKFRAYALPV